MLNFTKLSKDKKPKYLVEGFKKVVLKMHRGIPSFYFFGFFEKLVPTQEMRDYLLKKDVFVKSTQTKNQFGQNGYFLGVNGMILANSYESEIVNKNTEKLTKKVVKLTNRLLLFTLFLIILTIIQILLLFF